MRYVVVSLLFAVPALGQTSEEKATRRVQQLVEPNGSAGALSNGPQAFPAAKAVEPPAAPVTAADVLPPRPPVAAGKPQRPRPLKEGEPPTGLAATVRFELATMPLVQMPSLDADKPLPLPILARPKQDRAALDDVTMEASQAAALERVRPRRREPVPFTPVNLPDPFENSRTGSLRFPPEELTQPPAVPIRTPGR